MLRRSLAILLSLAASGLSAQPGSPLELKGWLEWVHAVELRVLESGRVEAVAVNAGQHVDAGDLLLRMDQREARAGLLEAQARMARARLAGEQAARALTRARELYDRGLIATEELRDAELGQAAAAAEEEAARAVAAARVVALEHTELRAPFAGIVVTRGVYDGTLVYKTLQDEPLIVVAPDDRMLARALVTADVLRRFRLGQPARVMIDGAARAGQVYSLGVQAVRVELEGAVYYLDVIFDRRPNELLRPSETVRILLP